jgi:hypothetical protein
MRVLITIAVLLVSSSPGLAQEAVCVDAYKTVLTIRERLFVGGQTPQQLREYQRRVKSRVEDCGDLKALWDLRLQLATLLKDSDERDVVQKRYPSEPQRDPVEHGAFDASTPVGKRWALLAGTSTFQHKDELKVRDLEYAEADLALFQRVLTTRLGFSDVAVLAGAKFTLDEWRASIAHLREVVQKDDLVLIYLVSHGQPTKEDRNNTSFILTHASRGGDTGIYTTSIQVIDVVQELARELKAQRVVIMLDACFSGDAISGQRDYAGHPAPYLLDAFTRGSGRAVFAAAKSTQRSWELPAKKQGAFAFCFDRVATPSATLGETFSAIKSCIGSEVASLGPGHDQEPELFASEGARTISLGASK